jgi:hypothetical protein
MIKRIRLATDEDWRKRPMTEGMFLLFMLLGVVLLGCGMAWTGTVMASAGVVVIAVACYARMRTLRALHRE